jgi:mannose/fructose/N-acetylgalactosamine-specific phosphotransferase system component IIC
MISKLLDWLSNFLAHRKGLLPLTGIAMVILNYLLQWLIYPHWLAASNLFLHLGIVIAIFGVMLAWAL